MPTMQNVEAAVGEHPWARQLIHPFSKFAGRAQLALKGGKHQSMYSNMVTTLLTPEVLRATSVAFVASECFTRPIR